MNKRRPIGWELFFALLVAATAVPIWSAHYIPIQDMPQHLAAIRVLHSYRDAAFHFGEYFNVDLWRTQYLGYYLSVDLLTYVFDLETANRIVMTAAICATPYGMASLLRSLGRDEKYALFVLPLTFNAHLVLGFMNFIAAIPCALFGLSLAVKQRVSFTRQRAIGLAIVAVVTFYLHVVPFAVLALGAFFISLDVDIPASVRRMLAFGPAVLVAVIWSRLSAAGQSTLTAALFHRSDSGPQPVFTDWMDALREAPQLWMTDMFPGKTDEHVLICWGLALLVALAFATRDTEEPMLMASLRRRVALLAPICAIAYFVTPISYDWIWPISARFPLLAALFVIPALPSPTTLGKLVLVPALAAMSLVSADVARTSFQTFDRDEVGAFDRALEAIPQGQRVAGLIFSRGSNAIKFSPFIHFVAYYQARKGGAVMFSFADFPQSPFQFKDENRPPRVRARWEWTPERVDPAVDLSWYNYVLVRGRPGRIASEGTAYENVFREGEWSVWRKL